MDQRSISAVPAHHNFGAFILEERGIVWNRLRLQKLKANPKIPADQKEVLDKYLAKYNGGLPGQAAFALTKMCVGSTSCKDAFSELAPGFMNDHAPATHEHPPVV